MTTSNSTGPYIAALRRSWLWVLLFGVAGALLAYAITFTIHTAYESHFSYVVSLSQRDKPSDFRFDGYYALQATDLFAATLAQWVQTPEVIVAAYQQAGLSLPTQDPRGLARIVRAQKTAPQLVEVTVRSDKSEVASALVQGVQAVMDERIDEYHDQGIPAVQFRVVASTPWQGRIDVARNIIVIATFVFVVFVGANVVLLAETFRQRQE